MPVRLRAVHVQALQGAVMNRVGGYTILCKYGHLP